MDTDSGDFDFAGELEVGIGGFGLSVMVDQAECKGIPKKGKKLDTVLKLPGYHADIL